MTDEEELSEPKYWGIVKGWGFTNRRRVTPLTYTMLDRDGDVCNIPDPAKMTPAQREAALELIKILHVRLDSWETASSLAHSTEPKPGATASSSHHSTVISKPYRFLTKSAITTGSSS